jgi:hypothetical protein
MTHELADAQRAFGIRLGTVANRPCAYTHCLHENPEVVRPVACLDCIRTLRLTLN